MILAPVSCVFIWGMPEPAATGEMLKVRSRENIIMDTVKSDQNAQPPW